MADMPRRNPPAKWVLPTVINPPARRCIMLEVPDDPAHIAAFRGALWALAAAYNWGDDPAHTAKDVAAVWREIIDTHQEWGCMNWSDLVFRQDECGLYVSTDGGETETLIYDGLLCLSSPGAQSIIEGFASALIDGLIADGTLPTGSQGLSPSNGPEPGSCQTFHASIDGAGQWMLPCPVSAGDTIELLDSAGGWMDGNIDGWYCPDGSRYVLNTCDATGKHYNPADVDPMAYHMAVIGRLVTSLDYFDLSAPYTVPDGYPEQNVIMMANDNAYGDNAGNINATIRVCNNEWTHTFDFRLSKYGWITSGLPDNWALGAGWRGVNWNANSIHGAACEKTFTATIITRIEIDWTGTAGDAPSALEITWNGGTEQEREYQDPWGAAPHSFIWRGNVTATRIMTGVTSGTTLHGNPGDCVLYQVKVSGLGADPF